MKIDKVLPGIVYLYSAEQTQKVNRCFCIRVMLCGIDSQTEEVRELGEEAVALFFLPSFVSATLILYYSSC